MVVDYEIAASDLEMPGVLTIITTDRRAVRRTLAALPPPASRFCGAALHVFVWSA